MDKSRQAKKALYISDKRKQTKRQTDDMTIWKKTYENSEWTIENRDLSPAVKYNGSKTYMSELLPKNIYVNIRNFNI